jgi:hypothetical protein
VPVHDSRGVDAGHAGAPADLISELILVQKPSAMQDLITSITEASEAPSAASCGFGARFGSISRTDSTMCTAAGVTAGLDLALALVEEDLGPQLARQVAAQLVMYFRRPGGQLQHSRATKATPMGRSILQDVQRWVVAHPSEGHEVGDLAARAGMSARHFARLFETRSASRPTCGSRR